MRIKYLILILCIAVLVGCVAKAPEPVEAPVVQQPPVEAPAQPAVEEPVVQEPVPQENTSDDGYNFDAIPKAEQRQIKMIRELMDKALAKTPNYFYRYTDPDKFQQEYWVKGDKIKIQVVEPSDLDKTTTKDVVYIDRATNHAEWRCEHDNMKYCFDGPGPWPTTVEEHLRMTPHEWLEKLGKNFRYAFDDRIQGVTYHIIDYTVDGKLVRMTLDSWSGIPLEIVYYPALDPEDTPVKSYLFEDPEFGVVKDSDVTP